MRQQAESGEWHIADVKTRHGLVLEFQHSHLDPSERAAREDFYQDMLWIVDGCRQKRSARDFFMQISGAQRWRSDEIYTFSYDLIGFPRDWLDCRHQVMFDFRANPETGWGQRPDLLWCLLPGRAKGSAVVISITPAEFLRNLAARQHPISTRSYMNLMSNSLGKIQARTRGPLRRAIF